MKLLFIADEIKKLNPAGDSSLVMARAAMQMGHHVFWATPKDILYRTGQIHIQSIDFEAFEEKKLPKKKDGFELPIEQYDAIVIRKDPPFDASFLKFCWLLSLYEKKIYQFNNPALLIRYHEKILQLEAIANGYLDKSDTIDTVIGHWPTVKPLVEQFKTDEIIAKPFLGYGGNEITKWKKEDLLNTKEELHDLIFQPFHSEVETKGDRRVLFLGGKYLADFIRMPKKGGYVSNLAKGGRAVLSELDKSEKKVIEKLEKFLINKEIDFAGADLIGDKISEVNITSPTGLQNLADLTGESGATKIIKYIGAKV